MHAFEKLPHHSEFKICVYTRIPTKFSERDRKIAFPRFQWISVDFSRSLNFSKERQRARSGRPKQQNSMEDILSAIGIRRKPDNEDYYSTQKIHCDNMIKISIRECNTLVPGQNYQSLSALEEMMRYNTIPKLLQHENFTSKKSAQNPDTAMPGPSQQNVSPIYQKPKTNENSFTFAVPKPLTKVIKGPKKLVSVNDRPRDNRNFINYGSYRVRFSSARVEAIYQSIIGSPRLYQLSRSKKIGPRAPKKRSSLGTNRKRKFQPASFPAPVKKIKNKPTPLNIDREMDNLWGPIPRSGSVLFKGMSFLIGSNTFEIDPIHRPLVNNINNTYSEHEVLWTKIPLLRSRLLKQLRAGGGRVYENFQLLPPREYRNTIYITDKPNLEKTHLAALSVGIAPINHQWIIRCCKKNALVNPEANQLPAGWSILTNSYIEMEYRLTSTPFGIDEDDPVVIVLPSDPKHLKFATFWEFILENMGAIVMAVDGPLHFMDGTVVVAPKTCPPWLLNCAASIDIPVVSPRWAIQCMIHGLKLPFFAHPSFAHDYNEGNFGDIAYKAF